MTLRPERLKRLVKLQRQIKALHELRHATHLASAAAAGREAEELLESLNTASPLPGLFADLYNRRIGAAMGRQARESARAETEAGHVAQATARTNVAERSYREAARLAERTQEEKDALESVERTLTDPK
jgi:hypothetical protein